MDEILTGIQMVMKTLEAIEIKSTIDNMEKLLGCQKMLCEVVSQLQEVKKDGANNSD